MSVLVRFGTGPETKARIFEQSSSRKTCVICKEEKRGMIVLLVRHLQPKKPDSAVCHECIVKLCLEPIETVKIEPVKKPKTKTKPRGRPKKRGVKRGTRKPKEKCPHCDRKMPASCFSQHFKAKHPDEYEKLINKSIEESKDASVEETGTTETGE
jgi:hypothetical protein